MEVIWARSSGVAEEISRPGSWRDFTSAMAASVSAGESAAIHQKAQGGIRTVKR